MENATTSLFPIAYGTEEEKGIMTDAGLAMDEPYDLVSRLYDFLPDQVRGRGAFLSNGFRVYPGGASGAGAPTNLEIATPECSTPTELVRWSRANDLLLRTIVDRYVSEVSEELGRPVSARTHRRVVDSENHRKACHDNYGTTLNDHTACRLEDHLASRSIVTGAGLVGKGQFELGQKIGGLTRVRGYGYLWSMYRIAEVHGSSRFEVRCSDVNISDWATLQRIGGVALVFAIRGSELSRKLKPMKVHRDPINRAKQLNTLPLTPDGDTKFNPEHMQAVDFQQRLAELAMQLVQLDLSDQAQEYFMIADELYRYCDDLRSVIDGSQDVEILADRADWAAKLAIIRRGIARGSDYGVIRHALDIKAMAADLRYDQYTVRGADGAVIERVEGTGYKLRNRKLLANKVTDIQAQNAVYTAPKTTRAHLRATLLRDYFVSTADWNRIALHDTFGNNSVVFLDDVTQSTFTNVQLEALEGLQEFRGLETIR